MVEDSSDKVKLKEINAKEILDKIEKGEAVVYDHVAIRGALDISLISLPNKDGQPVINSEISITNSQIDEDAIFDNAIFKSYISFERTHFTALASFVRVQFGGFNRISDDVVNFKEASFDQLAHFLGAIFIGGAIFKDAKFNFSGYIDRAKFCDYALFDYAHMSSVKDFMILY